MNTSDEILKIVSFLENKTLDDINKFIAENELKVFVNIEKVKDYSNSLNVTISVDKNNTFSAYFAKLTGIWGINPSYVNEFNEYTCMFSGLHLLWYKVRDTISDYYSYNNAEISREKYTVKMKTIHRNDFPEDGIEVIKEYKSGYTVYKLTGEILGRVDAVKWIDRYFNG